MINLINQAINFIKRKDILPIFLLAIVLRLLIMPFLFHPDIKTYNFQASFLQKGVIDIYSYLDRNKATLPLKEEFVYQPLTYFFLGGYQALVKPLLGMQFDSWLWDASQQAVEAKNLFRYLFLLKIPYLVLDLILAYLLTLFFQKVKNKKAIFSLWLFNPLTLIIIYAFSNLDIIPVLLTVVSLLLFKKGKIVLSALLLGLAGGFKAYPLLLLPIFAIKSGNFKKGLLIFTTGLLGFLICIIPFISTSFTQSALVSGLTTRIFLPSIDLGFGVKLAIPIIGFFIVYMLSFEKSKIEFLLFSLLMLLLSFIHYHIQWLLWIMPFLFILLVNEKKLRLPIILFVLISFILPLLFNDKSMTVGLYSGISYFYTLVPTPYSVISRFWDVGYLQSLLQSAMASLSIFIIWKKLSYKY